MLQSTGLLAISGIRTAEPFRAAGPAAWDDRRDFAGNALPVVVAVAMRRSGTAQASAGWERTFIAAAAAACSALAESKSAYAPVRLDWGRAFVVSRLASVAEAALRRADTIPAAWALGWSFGEAAHWACRSEALASASELLAGRAEINPEWTTRILPVGFALAAWTRIPSASIFSLDRMASGNRLAGRHAVRGSIRHGIPGSLALLRAWRNHDAASQFRALGRQAHILPAGIALHTAAKGNTTPAAWDSLGRSGAWLLSGFDGLPRWLDAAMPGAWEARPGSDDCLPGGWTWESSRQATGMPVAAVWRAISREAWPTSFDLYGRGTRSLRDAVFRMDWRVENTGFTLAAWDVWARQFIATGPQARWSLDAAAGEAFAWALGDPPRAAERFASRWNTRLDRRERMISLYDVALREYVRDALAFTARWEANRTPNMDANRRRYNAEFLYYEYFGRYWPGLGQRHDMLRDSGHGRSAARFAVRGPMIDWLPGNLWSLHPAFAERPLSWRLDIEPGPPPGTWFAAGWDQRPFGATGTRGIALFHVLAPSGLRVVARDTDTGVEIDLGFVPEDELEDGRGVLAGVALPDGEYAIEARPSSFFWPDARPGMAPIYRLQAGEPPEAQLPAVVNLTASISPDYWRMLEWSVEGDAGEADYALGVWFEEDAPLDLSRDPDAVIPRAKGLEHYGHFFRQTAPRHVAVAAFNAASRGREAAMFLPWDAEAPASPKHQWVENREK